MRNTFANFLRSARPQADSSMRIRPRDIYILPTGFGLLFFALLILLLIGSINYANNLGFLLTFFLAAVGLLAMVHTWRNLAGLCLRCGRIEPVFSGQVACFPFFLDCGNQQSRPDIELYYSNLAMDACDAGPNQGNRLELHLTMNRRGRFSLGRCLLRTRFPLSLFKAWSYLDPEANCLVYPKPLPWHATDYQNPTADRSDGRVRREPSGGEFHGLREYRAGDPLRHIYWKALARGLDLMSREFESPVSDDFWLDWHEAPGPDAESRLGQLCFAVLEAARSDLRFGLRLPEISIPPNAGDSHLASCLRSLALYGGGK